MYLNEYPLLSELGVNVPRPRGAAAASEPPTIPRVGMIAAKNFDSTSEENCCPGCPAKLGVGVGGTAQNAMELQFAINGHEPGYEYAINRTRRLAIWQRLSGVWRNLAAQPMGVTDNPSRPDLCLSPVGNRIFVVARAGFAVKLPAPPAMIFRGPKGEVSHPLATEVVLRASFADWVIARNTAKGIGWTNITPNDFLFWHSVTWLVRDIQNFWLLDRDRSEIDLKPLAAKALDSPPGP